MLIIYGTRNFKREKGKTEKYFHCTECGKDDQWVNANIWTWFTLFYIPLFPVWKKKVLLCPTCGCGIKINRKNQELLNGMIPASAQTGIETAPASEEADPRYAAEIKNVGL